MGNFISIDYRQFDYLNKNKLHNDISEFNNEMPLSENVVFNLIIIYYWHSILQFDTVKCFDTISIVKSAI